MREQLIQYVELLFAGAENCEDIKQEILQNTLDRYDDLIAEGKVPEAAYRLAITGIGDINEILGSKQPSAPVYRPREERVERDSMGKKLLRAIAVALYIICPIPLFVLSDMGMSITGLCGTLCLVAIATVLIILGGKTKRDREDDADEVPESELSKSVSGLIWTVGIALYFIISFTTYDWHITWIIFLIIPAVQSLVKVLLEVRGGNGIPVSTRNRELKKSVSGIVWALGLAAYFILSFATGAWYVTWVMFLIISAVDGVVKAIMDLKEAVENEK